MSHNGPFKKIHMSEISGDRAGIQDIFWAFFRIGLFTFGGGLAMLPVIRHELVLKKRWVRDEDFIATMSMATMVPGVIAVNTAYLLGRRLRGKAGSAVAVFGTVLPSFCVILLVAGILPSFFSSPKLQAFFKGAALAVAGQLAFAGFTFARKLLHNWQSVVIAGSALAVIALLNIHPIWGLISAAVLGYWLYPGKEKMEMDEGMP